MTTIKRRKFTRAAVGGVAAGAAMTTVAAPAISQQRQEWRMVTSWPKMFPGGGTAAERFAKTIGEATGGRLTIKVFAAGELVPAFEAFDAVQRGTADCHAFHALLLAEQVQDPERLHHRAVRHDQLRDRWRGCAMAAARQLWDEVYGQFRPQGIPRRLDERADGGLVQQARSSRRPTSKA